MQDVGWCMLPIKEKEGEGIGITNDADAKVVGTLNEHENET